MMQPCTAAPDASIEEKASPEQNIQRIIGILMRPKIMITEVLMNWRRPQKFLLVVAMRRTPIGAKRFSFHPFTHSSHSREIFQCYLMIRS